MRLASRMVLTVWLVLSVAPTKPASALAAQAGGGFAVRWVGQDGHDYVAPNNRLEPSDVQDMHLALSGLDPNREIVFVDVTLPHGKNQWQYNVQSFSWKAELKRSKGSDTADLFLEPGHVEAPQTYHVLIRYDDNSTREADVRSRKVVRFLRMPGVAVQARWAGQDRHDRVGPGPSVGPDGIQDVRIRLTGVSTRVEIRSMHVEGGGGKWESGTNPQLLPGAEFWPDPKKPGEGDLFIQPERDLRGAALRLEIDYANDTRDSTTVTAQRCNPKLRMPEVTLPKLSELSAKAEWLGQDGQNPIGPGDVHVRLSKMSRTPLFQAAVLSDSVRGTWVYRRDGNVRSPIPEGMPADPLVVRPGPSRDAVDLYFPPYRDETGSTLTLRFVERDGRVAVLRFPGGTCDYFLRAPRPGTTTAQAKPGDDLNALANQHGTVNLAPGTYRLIHPLVLDHPVNLKSEGKATLVFAQAPGDPPWTAAIKIHAGNTTLEGFAVRFEGIPRWDHEVSYGPAVIGTTDNRDQGHNDLKVNITLTRLDLEGPAAEDPSKWVEAVRLVRLTNARGGNITGNILRGGPIEFFDGPWRIVNNDYRGTPPGTYSHGVFGGHDTYDLLVQGNRAKPVEPEGKSWRFLVLTRTGSNDRVEDNTIEDIGARDEDTIPWSNEPEVIITEAYKLTYEGKLAALSQDGTLLRTYRPQGQEAAVGDVLSLLDGPAAGQYRRIAQVIDPQTFLIDSPIPRGTETVSVSRGFVGERFERNTIDLRRGKKSSGFVFGGNHFGTRIIKNHIKGGDVAVSLAACPTEAPVIWGWSHAPVMGAVVEGNTFEDNLRGGLFGVEHGRYVKTNKGRTYMSISLHDNVVHWSEDFLKLLKEAKAPEISPGLNLGAEHSHDAGEMIVKADRNHLRAPRSASGRASLVVHAAEYNARKLVRQKFGLPAAPAANHEGARR